MKPGKDFEARIRKRFEQAGCYVLRLADAAAPFVGRPDLGGEGLSRFAPKNPFDFLVLEQVGRGPDHRPVFGAIALELKSTAQPRFDLSSIRNHQRSGLLRFPGRAGVLVELRREKRCFLLRVEVLDAWKNQVAGMNPKGKKSMNLQDLVYAGVELPVDTRGRERKVYYSIDPLRAPTSERKPK